MRVWKLDFNTTTTLIKVITGCNFRSLSCLFILCFFFLCFQTIFKPCTWQEDIIKTVLNISCFFPYCSHINGPLMQLSPYAKPYCVSNGIFGSNIKLLFYFCPCINSKGRIYEISHYIISRDNSHTDSLKRPHTADRPLNRSVYLLFVIQQWHLLATSYTGKRVQ